MAILRSLLFAKIICPTEEESEAEFNHVDFDEHRPANVIDAAASGVTVGLQIAFNVGAMLIAFIGLIALADGITGSFLGQKLILNEFVAYVHLSPYLHGAAAAAKAGLQALDPRTLAILSFALCGFANFSSIAILIGGFSVVAPERRSEVTRYGLRVVAAGTLSNLMSATIAGIFLTLH